MAIITVAALKGGVGKTLTAVHLAHGLAQAGYQTLLVDCDPSSNASTFLCSARAFDEPGIVSFIRSAGEFLESRESDRLTFPAVPSDAIEFNVRERMDLLPGNGFELLELLESLALMARESNRPSKRLMLRQALGGLSKSYHFIVIDCSPSLDLLTQNAIWTSDLVLSPIDSGAMSLDALRSLCRFVSECPYRPYILALRSLVHRAANRTKALIDEGLDDVLTSGDLTLGRATGYRLQERVGVLESVIHRVEIANQLSYLRQTAFDSRAETVLREDYRSLVQEIMYYATVVIGAAGSYSDSPERLATVSGL